jgi:vacuolar-type H+-ATPase subunit I/STV1
VCQARDLLELQVASVALGLDVDPQAGLDQLPELRAQVEGEVEVIQSGVDDLLAVVRAVPEDSPEVSAFVGEVDGLIESAQASASEALEQLRNATEADNALLAGVAAVQAVAAAQSAYSAASEALAILSEVRNESGGPLSQAFDKASECA